MRVILRLEAYPDFPEERQNIVAMETMLERMKKWVGAEYPEWSAALTVIVGYQDGAEEARLLLAERWVSVP